MRNMTPWGLATVVAAPTSGQRGSKSCLSPPEKDNEQLRAVPHAMHYPQAASSSLTEALSTADPSGLFS